MVWTALVLGMLLALFSVTAPGPVMVRPPVPAVPVIVLLMVVEVTAAPEVITPSALPRATVPPLMAALGCVLVVLTSRPPLVMFRAKPAWLITAGPWRRCR